MVGNFIEEASNIFMLIKIIEQPSESFIDSHKIVMQIIKPSTVIISKLFGENINKSLIRLKIVKRVYNLLKVKINVSIEIFESDWMGDFIFAFSLL